MNEESVLLKKRFVELSLRASNGCYFTFSEYLGLSEQSALSEVLGRLYSPVKLFGGAEGCERVIARFGSEDEIGYSADFPISIILIEPKSERFAERLTHRDYLGSLMNLGIERDRLGDLVIRDKSAYLFCQSDIAGFIVASLERVRHTDVKPRVVDGLPDGELYRTEEKRIQISSERLDAVIARAFNLSREDAQLLFDRGLVYVCGVLKENRAYTPKKDEVISVRGKGRLIYRGVEGLTRKGKLNVTIEVYV